MQKADFQKLRNDILNAVCVVGGGIHIYSKNVIKILSILLIWTVLFTACTDPQNPVENIKKNTYPESLTSQEKENVSAFSTEKLSDSLSSMENVIELLEIHKDEEGASENLSLIKDIYAAIKDSGVTELTNESLDVNAIIKGIEDNANAIQGDIIALDTSYTDENGVKWVLSGDLAYEDEDGFFHFSGRKKRLIIIAGYNVYPTDIERVVGEFPEINECCAVQGWDNGRSMVRLYASLHSKDIDVESLKARISETLEKEFSKFYVPRDFVFMDELPQTPLMKIDFMKLTEADPEKARAAGKID